MQNCEKIDQTSKTVTMFCVRLCPSLKPEIFCLEFFFKGSETTMINFRVENDKIGITLSRHQLYFNAIKVGHM